MGNVYLFCFLLGFGFTVISALLGGLMGGGHHGLDAGGHDVGLGGHDVGAGGHDLPAAHTGGDFGLHGAHGSVGHGDGDAGHVESSMHLPLLSPLVLSTFLAGFGGSGLVYRQIFGDRVWLHMPLAVVTSGGAGLLVAFIMYKLTTALSSNRNARETDALAAAVEVTVTIPKEGTGEVAYISGGTRQTVTARSVDGHEYKQGSTVKVFKLADGTAWVGEASSMVAVSSESAASDSGPSRGEPVRERERH
jgi:hypothetical protein